MDLKLENKVIFISGSSKGIGLEIAKQFLIEGAKVVINGRDGKTINDAYNFLTKEFTEQKVLKINSDLCQESNIDKALQSTIDLFGRIDCVIANIGSGAESNDLNFNADIINQSFQKNLLSSILLAKSAIKFLQQDHSNKKATSSIIFISSIAGLEDLNAPLLYSIHKSGLISAAKKLSRKLGNSNIRVNVIAPGNIYFDQGVWDKKLKEHREKVEHYINLEVPLQCFGEPIDVANAALFLASEKAKFITGNVLVVDGGQTRSF